MTDPQPRAGFHAAVAAVVLVLILGLVVVTLLLVQPPPPVSCTAATHCTSPDLDIPDDHLDRRG